MECHVDTTGSPLLYVWWSNAKILLNTTALEAYGEVESSSDS